MVHSIKNSDEGGDHHAYLESETCVGGESSTFSSSNPFNLNRGFAEFNASSLASHGLAFAIQDVPVKLQRRIRTQINSGRPDDQQITYEHIKPGHPDFKKEYAQMVVDHYNQINHFKKNNEQNDREPLDPEVYSQVAAYQPGKLNYHFRKIPSSVKKEIFQSLGLTCENTGYYTKDTKIKIITAFRSQYMA